MQTFAVEETAPGTHFNKFDVGKDKFSSNLGWGTFSSFSSLIFHEKILRIFLKLKLSQNLKKIVFSC